MAACWLVIIVVVVVGDDDDDVEDGWVVAVATPVAGYIDVAAGCRGDAPAAGTNEEEEEEDSSSIDARRCTGKGGGSEAGFRIILIRLRAFWG